MFYIIMYHILYTPVCPQCLINSHAKLYTTLHCYMGLLGHYNFYYLDQVLAWVLAQL